MPQVEIRIHTAYEILVKAEDANEVAILASMATRFHNNHNVISLDYKDGVATISVSTK